MQVVDGVLRVPGSTIRARLDAWATMSWADMCALMDWTEDGGQLVPPAVLSLEAPPVTAVLAAEAGD